MIIDVKNLLTTYDLQSAVKKRPNLFMLCGFAIRINLDLKIYVVAAAVSSAVSATATLRCSAVILVGLPASTLTGTTTARRVLSSTAVLSPGGIVIVCHDLGELLKLGIAP